MNPRSGPAWIALDKVQHLLQLEPIIVIVVMALVSYLFYRIFLRGLSPERHRNLTRHFLHLTANLLMALVLYGLFSLCEHEANGSEFFARLTPYFGLLSLVIWANAIVKICQIVLYEYLFKKNMRVGVPVLLVNLMTVAMFFVLVTFLITELFGVRLAPLFATSAIFSVILGFALQDTLGNLFAGISLQIDKPFSIGDWIEIYATSQKWVGQVHEVSWRATVLIGWTDELITVPNRVMAQSQISNFSLKNKPILRSQVFRLPLKSGAASAKTLLIRAALDVNGVRKDYEPVVIFMDTTESWLVAKLVYYINDYSQQFAIGDRVIIGALTRLEDAGLELAHSRLDLRNLMSASLAEAEKKASS